MLLEVTPADLDVFNQLLLAIVNLVTIQLDCVEMEQFILLFQVLSFHREVSLNHTLRPRSIAKLFLIRAEARTAEKGSNEVHGYIILLH